MSSDTNTIPVVILCGGKGTRLREETEYKPKPMVEIGGRPILWHIMKMYAHYQLKNFILCLGYRGNTIKDYFLNYEAMTNDFTVNLGARQGIRFTGEDTEHEFEVTLAETGLNTMTGGRIKRIEKYIPGDTFMVTYGDGLADVDIQDTLRYHRSHGKIATLVATQPPSRYGILDLGEANNVRSFREKVQRDWINGGFFVFNRKIFDYLTPDCVLEQAPLEQLAAEDQLMAYCHNGFWMGMDTFREYELLNQMWDSESAPWAVWQRD
jgi:glucose-1-phosphate cytidylyltransferase